MALALAALLLALGLRLLLSASRGLRAFVAFARIPRVRVEDLAEHADTPRLRLSGRLRAAAQPLAALDGSPCVAFDREARNPKQPSEPSSRDRQVVPATLDDGTGIADLELEGFVLHTDGHIVEKPRDELPEALRPSGMDGTVRVTEHRLADDVDVVIVADVVGVERVAEGYREMGERHRLGGHFREVEIWPRSNGLIVLQSVLSTALTLAFGLALLTGAYRAASASLALSTVEDAAEHLELEQGILDALSD